MGILVQESPQKRAAKIKQAFRERFGDQADELAEIIGRVVHPLCFGEYRSKAGTGSFAHSRASLENHEHPRRITRSSIYRHFLSANKPEYIWFTNALPRITIGEKQYRLALWMIDIDCHGGAFEDELQSDAHEMLAHIQSHLPCLVGLYSESSTNSKGIHLYLPLLMPGQMSNQAVTDWGLELQQALCRISDEATHDHGITAVCREVRGLPPIREKKSAAGKWREYSSMGTLAKLPRLKDRDAAEAFLATLLSPTRYESLSLAIASLAPQGVQEQQELGDIYIAVSGEMDSPVSTDSPSLDAWKRMQDCAFALARQLNRVPTEAEILDAYEQSGLARQPTRHAARERRARQAHRYLEGHFQPLTHPHPLVYLAEVQGAVTDAVIHEEFKGKLQTLKHEDIALVLYLIRHALSRSLGRNYFLKASRDLKAKGQVQRTLCNKRIAASKRILARVGLIAYKQGKPHRYVTRYKVTEGAA